MYKETKTLVFIKESVENSVPSPPLSTWYLYILAIRYLVLVKPSSVLYQVQISSHLETSNLGTPMTIGPLLHRWWYHRLHRVHSCVGIQIAFLLWWPAQHLLLVFQVSFSLIALSPVSFVVSSVRVSLSSSGRQPRAQQQNSLYCLFECLVHCVFILIL